MSEIDDVVEMTYNQKAKEALLDVSKNDFWYLYEKARIDQLDNFRCEEDLEEKSCMNLMEMFAGQHGSFFAEHVLYKTFGDKIGEEILDCYSSKEFSFGYLQEILDELDAGNKFFSDIDL